MMVQQPGEQNVKHDADAERVQESFQDFLESFEVDGVKVYLAEIKELEIPERNTLAVKFNHVEEFSSHLAQWLLHEFYRVYPYICRALQLVSIDRGVRDAHKKELYVSVDNFPVGSKVRDLTADRIGTLLRISGQVVRTHPVHPELCRATFVCDDCGSFVRNVEQQFKYTQPTNCANAQCDNRTRFALDVHRSVFVDFQKVRIQEVQAELPRGAIPRAVEVIVRGEAVEAAQPGDRCDFTGTLIVVPDVAQLAAAGAKAESAAHHRGRPQYDGDGLKGLKALGVRELNYRLAFLACNVSTMNPKLGGVNYTHEPMKHTELWGMLSETERDRLRRMADDKRIEKKLIDSLFPAIYGHDDVKRGALLMLFGGVPKTTPEGTTLRGDINVCLVGDPSTAKSQVLKTVEEFCPRAVYTSGKASTAAGLTAAVVKDEESFEFVIEAGALMLADNGVCCIDEFDKMDPKDQVAIHEAMEQQTISITKAGVKATLNARASILAAANPIGGRYDRSKSLRSNIQMSAPIMSRFDLFFVLVDECNEIVDYAIARRIVDVHQLKATLAERPYSTEDIRRYIMFARCFNPVISEPAAETLVAEYKRLRLRDSGGAQFSSWRITVRQLESLVRLSEALARLHCSDQVTAEHVERASRLLHQSIVRVEQPDVALAEEDKENEMVDQQMDDAEQASQRAGPLQQQQQGQQDAPADAHPPGKRFKLSFEEYQRITNMLVMKLRQTEDAAGGGGGDSEEAEAGMRLQELVNWYLSEVSDQIDSEAELVQRKTLVERVIKRLYTQDNVLIQLSTWSAGDDTEQPAHSDDPILVVHPSYMLTDVE